MSTNTLRHLKFSSRIVSFLARSKNITLNPKFNTMSGKSKNWTTRMSGKTLDDILYPHIEPHKTGMLQVRFILTAMFLHKPTSHCFLHQRKTALVGICWASRWSFNRVARQIGETSQYGHRISDLRAWWSPWWNHSQYSSCHWKSWKHYW